MMTDPSPEHGWLRKLVGDWHYEHEFSPAPGMPAAKLMGTEKVRMLGELWVICEGGGKMHTGHEMNYLMTLGFDPNKGSFVGSWVGSPMAYMFVYEGRLEDDGKTLPLKTDGPSFTDPTQLAKYQDVIGIVDDDHRTLTSQMWGEEGELVTFMQAKYRRA